MRNIGNLILLLSLLSVTLSCGTARYARPGYLVAGDTVGIVTMSSRVDPERAKDTASLRRIIDSLGFGVLYAEHIFAQYDNSFGADDRTRADDFNRMVANPNVKAILLYKGGYGAVRTLDYIDWRALRRNPKWIAGYSDITMLHLAAQSRRIESLHSVMPSTFERDSASLAMFASAIKGELSTIHVAPDELNQTGVARGRLIGGNLSMLYAASGTPEDKALKKRGKVLFIEDLNEKLYHIDRMMQNLERAGVLQGCKAVVVGYMTDIEGLGRFNLKRAEELISSYTKKYNIPVVFGMPVGHQSPNAALYMGRMVEVEVADDKSAVVQFL